eukprot:600236-Amphidinium_carterae.1
MSCALGQKLENILARITSSKRCQNDKVDSLSDNFSLSRVFWHGLKRLVLSSYSQEYAHQEEGVA